MPIGYCLKGNCPTPSRDAPWPNWVSCQVSKGDTISLSYRGAAIAPLGLVSGTFSSRGGGGGNLLAANPGSPGSILKKLISSFSFASYVLLSMRGFNANSLLRIISFSVSLLNLSCIKT